MVSTNQIRLPIRLPIKGLIIHFKCKAQFVEQLTRYLSRHLQSFKFNRVTRIVSAVPNALLASFLKDFLSEYELLQPEQQIKSWLNPKIMYCSKKSTNKTAKSSDNRLHKHPVSCIITN